MWGWATVLVARVRLWSSSPANTQLGTWVTFAPASAFPLLHIALKWGQTGLRSLALWGLTCGLRSPIGPGHYWVRGYPKGLAWKGNSKWDTEGNIPEGHGGGWHQTGTGSREPTKKSIPFLCHTFPSQLPTLAYTCRPGLQRLNNETGMGKKQDFWGFPIFWTLTPHNTEYLHLQCS